MDSSYEVKTISKIFKYKPITRYIGLTGDIPVKHKDVYMGVELEYESLKHIEGMCLPNTIFYAEDNSLKLNGFELVSVPIKLKYLQVELERVITPIKAQLLTSKRCSVHIHMNVRDMTLDQLAVFVMIYFIFERGLYRISGDRWDNNFCVPLNMALEQVSSFFSRYHKGSRSDYTLWRKYTGLNLGPIAGSSDGSKPLGTVEFRQLHGTTDVKEIIDWCNIIASIKRAAQTIPLDEMISHIRTMKTTSGYAWLVKEVFGKYSRRLTSQKSFTTDVENSISLLKVTLASSLLKPKESDANFEAKLKKASPELSEFLFSDLTSLSKIEEILCADS